MSEATLMSKDSRVARIALKFPNLQLLSMKINIGKFHYSVLFLIKPFPLILIKYSRTLYACK